MGAHTQVVRIHTHIGSGSDPAVWQRVRRENVALRAFRCRITRG